MTEGETDRSVLTELLRLYDWRNELGRIERDFNHDKKKMTTALNQYGREKKAAWEAARRVLTSRPEGVAKKDPTEVLERAYNVLDRYSMSDGDGDSYNNGDVIEMMDEIKAFLSAPVSPLATKKDG